MNNLIISIISALVFGCVKLAPPEVSELTESNLCDNPALITFNPSSLDIVEGLATTFEMNVENPNQSDCEQNNFNISLSNLSSSNIDISPLNYTDLNIAAQTSITLNVQVSAGSSSSGSYKLSATTSLTNSNLVEEQSLLNIEITEESEEEIEVAGAIIDSVQYQNGNYVISFSQPSGIEAPAGGYDTWINGTDLGDSSSHSGLSRTISGLTSSIEQCFRLESIYTQVTTQIDYPMSNEVCVASQPSLPVYPQEIDMTQGFSWPSYSPPSLNAGLLPDYLQVFSDILTGYPVRRIGDAATFSVSDGDSKIRHHYPKTQPWNSDGTKIMLQGYPMAILDGSSYEFLGFVDNPGNGHWANTNPNIIYGTYLNDLATVDVSDVSNDQYQVIRTFQGYNEVSFGHGEGNISNDDRYIGLIGDDGSQTTLIVYDIPNDTIVGSKIVPAGDLDWFSVSPQGNYAVAMWRDDGSGTTEGIKVYDIDMSNERHIGDNTAHADIGIDVNGKEVIIQYGSTEQWSLNYSLQMIRLEDGAQFNLFPYINGEGIWGGHISTRNTDRPGWAYVSENCCAHETKPAANEVFAIKLDPSNPGIIQRFGKHQSKPTNYGNEAMAVPNRDGTKIIFASNFYDSTVSNWTYAPSFVLEVPQE